MQCYICNKNLGEYECSVCNKLVCEEHHKTIDGKIYCTNHTPGQVPKKEEKSARLSAIRSAVIGLGFTLVGMLVIVYIANYYITQYNAIPILGEGFVNAFKSVQFLMVAGIGFIFLILVIAYLAMRRKYI